MHSNQTRTLVQRERDNPAALATDHFAPRMPELLAPAGDWECAKAAVENRADAIYFGLEKFNARMRAHNFTEAGVDAAIVPDVGICRLIRQLSPDFPINASTQMTITGAAGVEFAKDLGCNLVVLARECSIKEIERIRGECRVSRDEGGGSRV